MFSCKHDDKHIPVYTKRSIILGNATLQNKGHCKDIDLNTMQASGNDTLIRARCFRIGRFSFKYYSRNKVNFQILVAIGCITFCLI